MPNAPTKTPPMRSSVVLSSIRESRVIRSNRGRSASSSCIPFWTAETYARGLPNNLRTIASNELVFVDDLQCQVGMLVLLRRIVGGINASEQQALYRKHSSRAASTE